MPITLEDLAIQNIDQLLDSAGWIIQDRYGIIIAAGRSHIMREADQRPRAPSEAGIGAHLLTVSEIRGNAN